MLAVFREELTGETRFFRHNYEANETTITKLSSVSYEDFKKATAILEPAEQAELVTAIMHSADEERVNRIGKRKAMYAEAGGRDKFLLKEAKRLVKEGKFTSIEDARWAVLSEIEILPRPRETEEALKKTAETGELPKDITNPEEIERVRSELASLAKEGKVEELARAMPRLTRLTGVDSQEVAQLALSLSKDALDNKLRGEISASGDFDITPENVGTLADTKIEFTNTQTGETDEDLSDAAQTMFRTTSKYIRRSGLRSDQPQQRVI